jgi:hypothetical protein
MIAPLMDSRGVIRYFIGAQVDVSGLLKSCSDLPGLAKLVDDEWERKHSTKSVKQNKKDEFQELSEMFNGAELDTVRRHGGSMHREYVDDSDTDSVHGGTAQRPRLMLSDPTQEILDKHKDQIAPGVPTVEKERINGKLAGVYQNVSLRQPKFRQDQMTNICNSTCSSAQRLPCESCSPRPLSAFLASYNLLSYIALVVLPVFAPI